MTIHYMKLTETPFDKISNWQKVIESRLFDEKRQKIKVGDQIKFECTDGSNREILTEVKALYHYPSFNELFSNFPPEYFGGESKDGLIKEIEHFYSKEHQKKYGVIGIKISLL